MNAGIRLNAQATYPNETVAIDLVGPMMHSVDGNVWILTKVA
jgi:hypothetical protein